MRRPPVVALLRLPLRGAIARVLSAVLCLICVTWASTSPLVHAAGAEQWQVGLAAGVDGAFADNRSTWGPQTGVDLQYGLNDAWALRASAAGSWHRDVSSEPTGGGFVTAMGLGLTYSVDVLRLIPFLELGVAAVSHEAESSRQRDLGVELGLGAEYLLTPRWTLALLLRYRHLPLRLDATAVDLGGTPRLFTAALRFGRLF